MENYPLNMKQYIEYSISHEYEFTGKYLVTF